jgi:hypothetical protein
VRGNGFVVETVNDAFNVYSAATGAWCYPTIPPPTS